jgi:DNA-binding IclR family transcriptional regulator
MPIQPSPAVSRAAELLKHLARHPAETFSVSELARAVGTPRATCDAVLLALAAQELVVRRADDLHYELGPACIVLGDAARIANPALNAASTEAERLARATSTCVALATRDSAETRVTDVFDFGPPFGIRTRVGQSIPLVPPFGAVFIAWEDDVAIDSWLAKPLHELSPAQAEHYRAALAAVRKRGYSVTVAIARRPDLVDALDTLVLSPDTPDARRRRDESIREFTEGEYLPAALDPGATLRISQLSAPVFDRHGKVAAIIIVFGSTYELPSSEIEAIGEQLTQAAASATANAGGRAPAVR